jgi:hypothetical protein
MPESIAIKERILRQIRTDMAAMTDVAAAYRWDARGETNYENLSAIIVEGDEEAEHVNIQKTDKMLPVSVCLLVTPDSSASERSSVTTVRWQARIEQKVIANRHWQETVGSVQLASDTHILSAATVEFEDGLLQIIVTFLVFYEHDEGNPYVLTGQIALLEE